jgi:hypothetical protein
VPRGRTPMIGATVRNNSQTDCSTVGSTKRAHRRKRIWRAEDQH